MDVYTFIDFELEDNHIQRHIHKISKRHYNLIEKRLYLGVSLEKLKLWAMLRIYRVYSENNNTHTRTFPQTHTQTHDHTHVCPYMCPYTCIHLYLV